jgi:hypothetical protein
MSVIARLDGWTGDLATRYASALILRRITRARGILRFHRAPAQPMTVNFGVAQTTRLDAT